MQAIDVLRGQLRQAHDVLEFAIEGFTHEQLHATFPNSTLQAPGVIYLHAVTCEDFYLSENLNTGPLIYTSQGWAEKLGIDIGNGYLTPEWCATVRIDNLPLLREYAQAVYAASDAHLATLTPEDLDQLLDFYGEMRLGDFIGRIMVWHISEHGGEVAAYKGLYGMQGLPY